MELNGGPAFPHVTTVRRDDTGTFTQITDVGLSMRDWFAGQALIGIMRRGELTENRFHPTDDAAWCYQIADAMLAERSKPKGE